MPTRTTASLIPAPPCNLLMHKVYDDAHKSVKVGGVAAVSQRGGGGLAQG